MIAQFPEPYPDELLYSILARYHVRSGHITYKHCFDDIYDGNVRSDIEYMNKLKPEIAETLEGINQVIINHTMFPSLRFHPAEKRKMAYDLLKAGDANYQNYVSKPNGRRYLRYCPFCVAEDREIHGETYWHRLPQIHSMTVCTEHGVKFLDSTIPIYSKEAASLIPADVYITDTQEIRQASEEEIETAKYIQRAFELPVNFTDDSTGEFLRQRVPEQYRSPSGISVRNKKFFDAFKEINPYSSLNEGWQIRKIFNGVRFDFAEICQLSKFLGIKTDELTGYEISKNNVVKNNNGKYRTYECDWSVEDERYLPIVKKTVQRLLNEDKPVRITRTTVARLAGIPHSTLEKHLSLCSEYIERYTETIEQYWKRKLDWAYQVILQQNLPLHKTQLHRLTNIEYDDMKRVVPLLDNIEMIEAISD